MIVVEKRQNGHLVLLRPRIPERVAPPDFSNFQDSRPKRFYSEICPVKGATFLTRPCSRAICL